MYTLTLYFLMTNLVMLTGDDMDGWSSRPQPSYEICMERKAHVERYLETNWKAFKQQYPYVKQVKVKCRLSESDG